MAQGQCWLRWRGPTRAHLMHVSITTAHRGDPLRAAGGVETSPYFLASAVAKPPNVFGSRLKLLASKALAQEPSRQRSAGRPLRNSALRALGHQNAVLSSAA